MNAYMCTCFLYMICQLWMLCKCCYVMCATRTYLFTRNCKHLNKSVYINIYTKNVCC